jgi:hypothetical protein
MAKLKLGTILDDKPVRLTIELTAATHRDLVAYAEALGRETGQAGVEPAKLIGPIHGDRPRFREATADRDRLTKGDVIVPHRA